MKVKALRTLSFGAEADCMKVAQGSEGVSIGNPETNVTDCDSVWVRVAFEHLTPWIVWCKVGDGVEILDDSTST